jgi:hypothetical protein
VPDLKRLVRKAYFVLKVTGCGASGPSNARLPLCVPSSGLVLCMVLSLWVYAWPLLRSCSR